MGYFGFTQKPGFLDETSYWSDSGFQEYTAVFKKSEGIMTFSYYGENLFSCFEKLKKKKKHERSLITQLNCQES